MVFLAAGTPHHGFRVMHSWSANLKHRHASIGADTRAIARVVAGSRFTSISWQLTAPIRESRPDSLTHQLRLPVVATCNKNCRIRLQWKQKLQPLLAQVCIAL